MEIVADFVAEAAALDAVLADLSESDWLLPTPADRWDVRDSVVHLAMSNELAFECVTTGRSTLIDQVLAAGSFEQFEQGQLDRGRAVPPLDVLVWWRASTADLAAALDRVDPSERIPWGPNRMSAVSFVTARLMETWAHGLDCLAAVKVPAVDTDRLRHIAHLGLRSLPYAFGSRGLPAPGPVRLELVAPDGSEWRLGEPTAPTVVTGTAADWCRAAVNRDRAGERERLHGEGPDAAAVIANVRAYLSA